MTQITGACKRPCHDCPFRTDVPKYQRRVDVLNNLRWLLDPDATAACHHTVITIEGGRSRRRIPQLACAGFLILSQKEQLPRNNPVLIGVRPKESVPIYNTLGEFADKATGPVGETDRWRAWFDAQPRREEEAASCS